MSKKKIFLCAATGLTLGFVALLIVSPIADFRDVRAKYQPSDLPVFDASNRHILTTIRVNHQRRQLHWVRWQDVSPILQETIVDTEDKRFWFHPGVDPLAATSAAWQILKTGRVQRGASTITMQLVSMISGAKARTPFAKILQMLSAFHLEWHWRKEEIVEAYINLLPFRGDLVGLRGAAEALFDVPPEAVGTIQAAVIAALIRSPNAKRERVAERACYILRHSNCSEIQQVVGQALAAQQRNLTRSRDLLPIIASDVVAKRTRDGIATTLDFQIQSLTMETLRNHLKELRRQNVKDGAVLVLDTKTGTVLAYAANPGRNFASQLQVDGIFMRRQAGSTLKPFFYASAMERGIIVPSSPIDDSPLRINVGGGSIYEPRNYDHKFHGIVTAGEALASSLNIPAVKVVQLLGVESAVGLLNSLGFTALEEPDFYGPSLALGTVDVNLWELTHAYRALAAKDSIFAQKTREQVFAILASTHERRLTFGSNSILGLDFPAAVKTGTSKDMRDNWCIGLTENYVVGVWVGNFDGAAMWRVSGVSGAAPIWRSIMQALHHPEVEKPVLDREQIEIVDAPKLSRFTHPVEGLVVAQDPDIPKNAQLLPIEVENPQPDHKILVNGVEFATATPTALWPIAPGSHALELRSAAGNVVDRLQFVVK